MLMAAPRVKRVLQTIVIGLVATGLVIVASSVVGNQEHQNAEFCAIMPDTVGLYVGNKVTQMGVRVGKVTAVTPEALSVRVHFTVSGRPLPDNVKAVIRSASVLADRSLELVGNYHSGPQLPAGGCIPLGRSFTPKSLTEVVGSATDFINAINPQGSTNIGDVLTGVDKAVGGEGAGINKLLTTTSAVLDSSDQAIGDIGSITKNLAVLTSTLRAIEPSLQEVLTDANKIGPHVEDAVFGTNNAFEGIVQVVDMVAEIEKELGPEIQQTLDVLAVVLRKMGGRAPWYASLANVAPRLITGVANFVQTRGNSGFAAFTVRYRPPLYRIRTPDGAFQCGYMNAAMPGSCANVEGRPYAVDVALLQYVLTMAAKR